MVFSNEQIAHIEKVCGKEAAGKLRDERMKRIQEEPGLTTFYNIQDVIPTPIGLIFDCIEKRPSTGKVECERVFMHESSTIADVSVDALLVNYFNLKLIAHYNEQKGEVK